jgi:hypothetical protein
MIGDNYDQQVRNIKLSNKPNCMIIYTKFDHRFIIDNVEIAFVHCGNLADICEKTIIHAPRHGYKCTILTTDSSTDIETKYQIADLCCYLHDMNINICLMNASDGIICVYRDKILIHNTSIYNSGYPSLLTMPNYNISFGTIHPMDGSDFIVLDRKKDNRRKFIINDQLYILRGKIMCLLY